mgnify:CR=1 FL=1
MNKLLALLFAALCLVVSISAQDCRHARILGATYGTSDVTSKVAHSYNTGTKTISASNETLGADATFNGLRTLTVVYERCSNVATVVAIEGSSIVLP